MARVDQRDRKQLCITPLSSIHGSFIQRRPRAGKKEVEAAEEEEEDLRPPAVCIKRTHRL